MTTYYVTTSGSDSNNGLTEGTAFATPGHAAGQATTAGDIVYVKEGTYTLSTTTVNASGGPVSIAGAIQMEGYKTTIGDRAARPVINAGSQAVADMITFAFWGYNINPGPAVRSIEVDGNSVASTGINANTPAAALIENCIARNLTTGIVRGYITGCYMENCDYGISRGWDVSYSAAKSCGIGFYRSSSLFRSIAYNSTNIGISFLSDGEVRAHQCVSYNNSSHGFYNGYDRCNFVGCLSVSNGGWGYSIGTGASDAILIDCADYDNFGRMITSNPTRDIRPINLTTDPFTSASTGDFRINDVAGGGAELRQIQLSGLAGVNSVFDIGAIDAVVTAGGGNIIVIED